MIINSLLMALVAQISPLPPPGQETHGYDHRPAPGQETHGYSFDPNAPLVLRTDSLNGICRLDELTSEERRCWNPDAVMGNVVELSDLGVDEALRTHLIVLGRRSPQLALGLQRVLDQTSFELIEPTSYLDTFCQFEGRDLVLFHNNFMAGHATPESQVIRLNLDVWNQLTDSQRVALVFYHLLWIAEKSSILYEFVNPYIEAVSRELPALLPVFAGSVREPIFPLNLADIRVSATNLSRLTNALSDDIRLAQSAVETPSLLAELMDYTGHVHLSTAFENEEDKFEGLEDLKKVQEFTFELNVKVLAQKMRFLPGPDRGWVKYFEADSGRASLKGDRAISRALLLKRPRILLRFPDQGNRAFTVRTLADLEGTLSNRTAIYELLDGDRSSDKNRKELARLGLGDLRAQLSMVDTMTSLITTDIRLHRDLLGDFEAQSEASELKRNSDNGATILYMPFTRVTDAGIQVRFVRLTFKNGEYRLAISGQGEEFLWESMTNVQNLGRASKIIKITMSLVQDDVSLSFLIKKTRKGDLINLEAPSRKIGWIDWEQPIQ